MLTSNNTLEFDSMQESRYVWSMISHTILTSHQEGLANDGTDHTMLVRPEGTDLILVFLSYNWSGEKHRPLTHHDIVHIVMSTYFDILVVTALH